MKTRSFLQKSLFVTLLTTSMRLISEEPPEDVVEEPPQPIELVIESRSNQK